MTSPIPEVGVLVEYGDEFWMEDMARELSAAGTYHPLWTVFAGLMERHFVAPEEAADVDVIQRACKRFYSLTGGVEQVNLPFKVGPLQPKEAMMLLMGRQQLEARACSVPIDALTSLPAEIAIFGDIHFVVKLRSPSDVIKVSFHTQLVQHHYRVFNDTASLFGTVNSQRLKEGRTYMTVDSSGVPRSTDPKLDKKLHNVTCLTPTNTRKTTKEYSWSLDGTGRKTYCLRTRSGKYLALEGAYRSSKLTGELLAASGGLALGNHCPTRWLGMVPVLQRLARVKDAVIAVCQSNKWNLPFEWDEVDDAIRLLLPWFKAVATLSADTTPTINLVVAECLGLVDQTEDYLSGSPHFESFGTNLVRELKKRLAGSVFNLRQAAPNAEPLYLIAALLDPYTAPALDDATFDAAKEELVRHLKNKSPPKYKEDDIIFDINDDIFIENSAAPIPGVKRRREPRVSEPEGIHVVHKPAVQRVVNPDHVQYLKAVSCYVRFLEAQQLDHGGAYHENRVWRFWTGTHDFRPLRDTALAALVVPASSTAAERMFSIAGHLTGGRNGQLGPQVLNAKLTMRLNADTLKSMK